MYLLLFILFNLICINGFNYNPKINNWLDLPSKFKLEARNWFIKKAENKGIPWNNFKNQYISISDELTLIKDLSSNSYIYYPPYYKKSFHGYNDGNLNWEAAFEGVAATLSMSCDYWKNIDPKKAHSWLRSNYSTNIKKYYHDLNKTSNSLDVLDLGCSVGIGTEFLYKNLKPKSLTGLDLSPFFLSIAKFRSKKQNYPINYVHANAEYMPFEKERFDLIAAQFLFHEVPKNQSKIILDECYRTLNNDSVIAIIDLDPENLNNNKIINFVRKWLFEITEPHIKQYYNTNMTELLLESGFTNVKKVSNNDPFNSVWLGYKTEPKLKKYVYEKINEQDILMNLKKTNKGDYLSDEFDIDYMITL